jgi:MFS family permease
MTTRDLFEERTLGTAMGLLGAMFLTVGAIGPVIAGLVAEATDSRAIPVIGAGVVTALAAIVIPGD